MTVYVYDEKLKKVVEKSKATNVFRGPYIQSDLPAYKSPLGTGVIEGRAARREDLKRGNCREVDPSERLAAPPKTAAEAAMEKAQLDARRQNPFQMSERTRERLLRGE